MGTIKELVFTLCLVALLAGVFRMLAPPGGLQRTAIMVTGLFTLVCFLSPFANNWDLDSLFSFSLEELVPSQNILTQQPKEMEQAAVAEITQTVFSLAQAKKISVKVTGVKLEKEKGIFMVQTLSLLVDGTGKQAGAFRECVEEVMKCEVSVAWTKE